LILTGPWPKLVGGKADGALLLDHRNQPLEPYPSHLIEQLAEGGLSPDARQEFDRLHREKKRIKCADGVIRHVVQKAYPFLRVNLAKSAPRKAGAFFARRPGVSRAAAGLSRFPRAAAR
jgi:hypothetical protein